MGAVLQSTSTDHHYLPNKVLTGLRTSHRVTGTARYRSACTVCEGIYTVLTLYAAPCETSFPGRVSLARRVVRHFDLFPFFFFCTNAVMDIPLYFLGGSGRVGVVLQSVCLLT